MLHRIRLVIHRDILKAEVELPDIERVNLQPGLKTDEHGMLKGVAHIFKFQVLFCEVWAT